jgi:hypothetical protein
MAWNLRCGIGVAFAGEHGATTDDRTMETAMNLHNDYRLAMFSRGGLTAHSLYARVAMLLALLPLAAAAMWMTASDNDAGVMSRVESPLAGALRALESGERGAGAVSADRSRLRG